MENYIVSARKYRPSSFGTVVGQHALTTTLKNAIATGKLAHAYLFCGPRGVGKTTCARIFAKTINCLSPTPEGDACNACESCRAFNEQRSYNIHELDAASNNSVDEIKQLMEQVRIPPQIGKYKVFIIDEVHMLSSSAFNAFLKTLEEPPKHAIFILATTEKHKILPTILSRCQIYDFSRMTVEDIVNYLQFVASKEGIHVEPEALAIIAQKADGGMRDALSIFDQVASYTQGNITYKGVIEDLNVLDYEYYFRLTDLFLQNKVSDILLTFDEILRKGFDATHFVNGLSNHFRDLLVAQNATTLKLLEVSPSIRERYQQQAAQCKSAFLYRAMKLCCDCDLNYRTSNNKRFLIELMLIQVAQLTEAGADSDESSGPRPTQLKPLFHPAAPPSKSVAPQPATPVMPVNAPNSQTPAPSATENPRPHAASAATTENTTSGNPPPVQPLAETKKIPQIKKGGSLGFSIKRLQQDTAQKEAEQAGASGSNAQSHAAHGNPQAAAAPLASVDLSIHWRGFAHSLPQEQRALQQRMLNMELTVLNEKGTFEVVADNDMIVTDLNQIKPQIEQHLRHNLQNSHIQMQIRIRDIQAQKEIRLTAGERYQKILENNSALRNLREELGLELS